MTSDSGRATVVVRQVPDAQIACGILGFLTGLILAGLVVGIGVPDGPALGGWWNLVFVLVWLVGGAGLGARSFLTSGIRFRDDGLVIARPTGVRRVIPWEHIQKVDVEQPVSSDGTPRGRYLTLLVATNDGQKVVRTGIRMPDVGADSHTRFGELRRRVRNTVIERLEAHGITVPTTTTKFIA